MSSQVFLWLNSGFDIVPLRYKDASKYMILSSIVLFKHAELYIRFFRTSCECIDTQGEVPYTRLS